MELIDSHCHLPSLEQKEKLKGVINRAKEVGVVEFINIGTSLKDNSKALAVAKEFPEIYATAAVYPHEDMRKDIDLIKRQLKEFVIENKNDLVGVGETGIDITDWENGRPLEDQVELFEFQAHLAKEHNLPLVIHNRNGDSQILEVLRRVGSNEGVIHCFSSEWKFAEEVLSLGFHISFSGFITYNSRRTLLETVKKVPNDRFLIETDSPYLPPTGHRGQRNEPKYVKIVAKKIAEVKGLSLDEVAAFSTNNARELFNL